MQVVNGKTTRQMAAADVAAWAESYRDVTLDIGAGDGRFVREIAARHPVNAAIGVDLCAGNLRTASRRSSDNAIFVVADALDLPEELRGLASRITINFPWGSLLRGLLDGHPRLIASLRDAARPGANIQIRLNAGALAEAGWTLDEGRERIVMELLASGFASIAASHLAHYELRRIPTTWAKRLAFGRDPRAIQIDAMVP